MTVRRNTAELERSRAGMLRAVRVAEVDAEKALVRVWLKAGENDESKSAWLPLINSRAGGDRAWHLPDVDEQMMLFAPDGNTESAVLLGGIYSKYGEQPSQDPDLDLMAYADGASVRYHRGDHAYAVDVPDADGTLTLAAGAEINAAAGVSITLDSGGRIVLRAATEIILEAPKVTIAAQALAFKTPALSIDAPTLTLTGNLTVTENIFLGGQIQSLGFTPEGDS